MEGEPTPVIDAPPVDPAPIPDPAPVDPPAEPTGIFSDGFTFKEGWTDELVGDDFDESRSTLAQYKDFPSVAKALIDNKRAATARTDGMVKIPNAESSPEEIAAYHSAIGIPETAEGYDIKPPEQLPEGVDFQPETLTAFAEFAHKSGLTNEQVNGLIAWQAKVEGQSLTEWQAEQEQGQQAQEQELQKEWGAQWQQKSMDAKRAAATFGIEQDSPILQSAEGRRALAKIASAISEDSLVKGEAFNGTLSPGNEAADIMSNPDNPLHTAYHDPSHPEHERAYTTYMNKVKEQVKREG